MEYGLNYLKCELNSGNFHVGKISENADKMIEIAKNSIAAMVAFPELSLCGYSLGELIQSKEIMDQVNLAIIKITKSSENLNNILIIGAPFIYENNLYNCAYVIYNGKILGIVPKSNLPISKEFTENRYFNTLGIDYCMNVEIGEYQTLFGQMVFKNIINDFTFGIEICADLWSNDSPNQYLVQNGAQVIFNLSASTYNLGKRSERSSLVKAISLKNICAYLYVSSNSLETSSGVIFDNCQIAYLDGKKLCDNQNNKFAEGALIDVDLQRIQYKKMNVGYTRTKTIELPTSCFKLEEKQTYQFSTELSKTPFIDEIKNNEEETLNILATSLMIRANSLNIKDFVLGLSGGVDSVLTMIIAIRALKLMNLDNSHLHCYILPMNHSSKVSIDQAIKLCKLHNCSYEKLNIDKQVRNQLKLISHPDIEDVTFENAQARYRTYTLLNIANMKNALMLGTGDMSEIALGFCTFGGDHLAHFNCNGGLPKTVVKYLTMYVAQKSNKEIKNILMAVANKKYSPELLSKTQISEDYVGSYEVNDFIMYELLGKMASVRRVNALLKLVFPEVNSELAIKNFVKRFKASQFKRNTAPDSIKVFDLSLDKAIFKMPSDIKMFDIDD